MKKNKKNNPMKNIEKKIQTKIGLKKTQTLKKLILFTLGGLLTLSTKLILSYVLTDKLKINLTIAYLITLAITIIIGYLYSYYVTFKNKTHFYKKLIKYLLSVGIFYAMDYMLVILATNVINMHYMISIIIVTTIIFMLKFVVFDNLIFKDAKK